MSSFVWNGDQILNGISARIDQDAHRIGEAFVKVAQTIVHVETGFLRSTISYAYDPSTHTISFIAAAPYAIFEELGTRHRDAHPFIRPAINMVGSGGALASGSNIYGFATEMLFTNVIPTDKELLFGGGRYIAGKGITAGQKRHVKYNLKPAAERHHVGNVSRTKMRVEHKF